MGGGNWIETVKLRISIASIISWHMQHHCHLAWIHTKVCLQITRIKKALPLCHAVIRILLLFFSTSPIFFSSFISPKYLSTMSRVQTEYAVWSIPKVTNPPIQSFGSFGMVGKRNSSSLRQRVDREKCATESVGNYTQMWTRWCHPQEGRCLVTEKSWKISKS